MLGILGARVRVYVWGTAELSLGPRLSLGSGLKLGVVAAVMVTVTIVLQVMFGEVQRCEVHVAIASRSGVQSGARAVPDE